MGATLVCFASQGEICLPYVGYFKRFFSRASTFFKFSATGRFSGIVPPSSWMVLRTLRTLRTRTDADHFVEKNEMVRNRMAALRAGFAGFGDGGS